MDAELRRLVDEMGDAEVLGLAVAVRRELDAPASDAAFAALPPEEAKALLDGLERLDGELERAADLAAAAAVARSFLALLLRTGAFDRTVALAALDTGVRFGVQDLLSWFRGSFSVAGLLGIRFEYVSEGKVVTRTDTGWSETSRTIRVAVGKEK